MLTTPNVANWTIRLGLLVGRWRYTERGILDRTHAHLFTRKTLVEALERAGYRVVALDFTVPVPVVGTPTVERVAHAVGRVRPSLFAYQFVVAATPRDLGRHPREERRARSRPLPRGDPRPAGGRRGRGRRRRLGLDATGAPSARGRSVRGSSRSLRTSSTTAAPATSARSSHEGTRSSSRARTRTRPTTRGSPRSSRPSLEHRRRGCLRSAPGARRGSPPERYFLDFLYGPEPRVQRVDGPTDVNFETTLFSNVNSAIPRALLGSIRSRRTSS